MVADAMVFTNNRRTLEQFISSTLAFLAAHPTWAFAVIGVTALLPQHSSALSLRIPQVLYPDARIIGNLGANLAVVV